MSDKNCAPQFMPLYGEVLLALHNVAAKKLCEEAEKYRLDAEAFYETILDRFWDHAEFRQLSNRLVDQGTHHNMYHPYEAKCTIAIFGTQFFEQPELCQELLTSYAIGLMHKVELLKLDLSAELKIAAMI